MSTVHEMTEAEKLDFIASVQKAADDELRIVLIGTEWLIEQIHFEQMRRLQNEPR